ncbi:DUF6282 family protein [Streptomyces sp. SL13]|jgi:hypothetical protein|uniref:DUF6282 family protein n=1 Tax=Streptantibioticus silvisoli TaxID=2705255 RepID=A0AA90K9J4_9ACTN|nr:DUF6282 family protein [Streptantibioticus silvisoli]MDI5967248.1 DUF6282 family protein [Streptantibioticus silvisoli]MDI5971218.1 DUF6282 family protein [Streptantibioticus silvisoli]
MDDTGVNGGEGGDVEERTHLAEARLRDRRGAPHDRFLASYRARMGYKAEILRPPAVHGVRDAVDIHCHAHEGQQDALAVAQLASASGMKGLLFKSVTGRDRTDVTGPAGVLREVRAELEEWGERTGIEPVTTWPGWIVTDTHGLSVTEACRRQLADGVKAVWMPVFRSANTLNKVGGPPIMWGGSKDPNAWSDPLPWEEALRVGVHTLDGRGRLKPEYKEVFRMVADHDVMISFAHSTHDEIDAMAEEVRDLGITKAVVDHPFSPFIDLSLERMRELTSAGVVMNFTYDEISPLLGVNPEHMCRTIQALGTEHVTLSSDAGEPLFPNTVEAIRLLRAHMRAFGLTDDEIHRISSVNPARLLDAA